MIKNTNFSQFYCEKFPSTKRLEEPKNFFLIIKFVKKLAFFLKKFLKIWRLELKKKDDFKKKLKKIIFLEKYLFFKCF
ncbi:MAG: hypothetical protein B6I24_02965 [Bacteroidetes bacterium 4572_128]|nr:MAG: hypothetical protein B6I24_02965 [Bacteroidetes bacterium 4572_128]